MYISSEVLLICTFVPAVFPGLCSITFSPFIFITLVDALAFSLSKKSIEFFQTKIKMTVAHNVHGSCSSRRKKVREVKAE